MPKIESILKINKSLEKFKEIENTKWNSITPISNQTSMTVEITLKYLGTSSQYFATMYGGSNNETYNNLLTIKQSEARSKTKLENIMTGSPTMSTPYRFRTFLSYRSNEKGTHSLFHNI